MDQPIFHSPPTMTSAPNAFHSARLRLGRCPPTRLESHSSLHALCKRKRRAWCVCVPVRMYYGIRDEGGNHNSR